MIDFYLWIEICLIFWWELKNRYIYVQKLHQVTHLKAFSNIVRKTMFKILVISIFVDLYKKNSMSKIRIEVTPIGVAI